MPPTNETTNSFDEEDVAQTPFEAVSPEAGEPQALTPGKDLTDPSPKRGWRSEDDTANETKPPADQTPTAETPGTEAGAETEGEADTQTPADTPFGERPSRSLLDEAAAELNEPPTADLGQRPDVYEASHATAGNAYPPAVPAEGGTGSFGGAFGIAATFDRASEQVTLRLGKAAATLGAAGLAVLAIGTVAFVRLATTMPAAAVADVQPAPDAESFAPAAPTVEQDENGTPVLRLPVVPDRPTRAVGLNYLVLQSFPRHADAISYQKRMERAGIDCSVERGLPGFTSKSWYSVVGTRGFDLKTDKDEYQRRVRQLEDLGTEPQAYKWRID